MTVGGGYIAANLIGGAIAGAIGAGVSQDSGHPIVKGAIITGLISAGLAAVLVATSDSSQIGVSGLHNPRIP